VIRIFCPSSDIVMLGTCRVFQESVAPVTVGVRLTLRSLTTMLALN
jgi:hypothetical protein